MAAEWLEIPTEVLRQARKRKGLSYESAARGVPVASKTWERWEKRGRIPLFHADRVAAILDLEIERPAFPTRVTAADGRPATLEAVRDEVRSLGEKLDGLIDFVEGQSSRSFRER